MHTRHGQILQYRDVLMQIIKISRQQQLQAGLIQTLIDATEGVLPRLRQIQNQNRFVNLYPFHTLNFETGQHLFIHRQQRIQQGQLARVCQALIGIALAQPQPGQGSGNHGLDLVPQSLGLFNLLKQEFTGNPEALTWCEFGHDVVVVCIEPLGHFTSSGRGAAGRTATRHAKQGIQ